MRPENYLYNNILTIVKVIETTTIVDESTKNDIIDTLYNLNHKLAAKGPLKDYAYELLNKWNEKFSDEDSYYFYNDNNEPIASLMTSEGYFKLMFKDKETALEYEIFREYVKDIGFGYYSFDKIFRRKRYLTEDIKFTDLAAMMQLKFDLNKQIIRQR